jgi:hypothetical protein
MTIKVLKLDEWMKHKSTRNDMVPCKPTFNRNGHYYDSATKKCWFEVNGESFNSPSPDDFMHRLQRLNHRPLMRKEREAIEVLKHSNLASKEQLELLANDYLSHEIKQLAYNTKKLLRRFAKSRKTLT